MLSSLESRQQRLTHPIPSRPFQKPRATGRGLNSGLATGRHVRL